MESRYYHYAGLRVVSEVQLPEWAPFEQASPGTNSDVIISLGGVLVDELSGAPRRIVTATECQFLVPGTGSFQVKNGREIVVKPAPGVAARRLRPWLIGSAWGALCYQRGLFLIHASAVMIDGSAVLFCALAKRGKSTMAAQLNTKGYPLLSDDLCHVDISADGVPVVYPGAPRLKLWSDALDELGWDAGNLEPDQSRPGKFHVVHTADPSILPAPVRAIYLLEWGEFGIRRLAGLNALQRFLAASIYRPGILGSMGQLNRYSTQSMTLLQRVPLWELQRPRDLAMIANTADLLITHCSEHRMMDK
jgi:hypothetical protein